MSSIKLSVRVLQLICALNLRTYNRLLFTPKASTPEVAASTFPWLCRGKMQFRPMSIMDLFDEYYTFMIAQQTTENDFQNS